MLKDIGVDSFEELIAAIPGGLRLKEFALPDALNELDLIKHTKGLSLENKSAADFLSFLGAGCYEHFTPSIVNHVLSRSEFYTAYTPYQAEASQGTLQTIFEYQTMMSELTGMDLSNASNYDGASATAEAALLSLRHTGRNKILVARSLHPEYSKTVETYLSGSDFEIVEIPFTAEGFLDKTFLEQNLDDSVASLIVQTPNFLGLVEDFEGISEKVHQVGALFIMAVNPTSLGLFKSPGEWGADIAVGEGQPLGVPMSLGGPSLGFFAVKKPLMRKIPGRLVGLTLDRNEKRCFTLTLQAREQHIRREKAGSNICTNQALLALAACVYLAALGKEGMKDVAEFNYRSASYLKNELAKIDGLEVPYQGTFFNEFILKSNKISASELNKKLYEAKIFGGVELKDFYSDCEDSLLVCVTETKSQADLDYYISTVKEILS